MHYSQWTTNFHFEIKTRSFTLLLCLWLFLFLHLKHKYTLSYSHSDSFYFSQSHSLSLSFSLSLTNIFLTLYLTIYLFIPFFLSLSLSLSLSHSHPPYLPHYLSLYLFISLSLFLYLSLNLSLSFSISHSIYLFLSLSLSLSHTHPNYLSLSINKLSFFHSLVHSSSFRAYLRAAAVVCKLEPYINLRGKTVMPFKFPRDFNSGKRQWMLLLLLHLKVEKGFISITNVTPPFRAGSHIELSAIISTFSKDSDLSPPRDSSPQHRSEPNIWELWAVIQRK